MKNEFVADGETRFNQVKQAALRKEIRTKYTAEFASAPPLKKLRIKIQIWREFLRCRNKGHQPSSKSLW
jgi:hypothetical protein